MFDVFRNRLEVSGILTTVTALRVGAGRSSDPLSSDLPVMKDTFGRPIIPGASFKGAMRSRLESFLRGVNPDLAEDPVNLTTVKQREIGDLKKKYGNNDLQLTQEILKKTDCISQLFGAPWLAGKFQVRDLMVINDRWFGQYQERNGVMIDRDTEVQSSKKLYDFQVVPAGTPFSFKLVVENAVEWELGLLLVGLHQFATQQVPLGGGRSRGLGVVELVIDRMDWVDVTQGEAIDRTKLMTYLQQAATGQPMQDYGVLENKELKQQWMNALLSKLNSTPMTTTVKRELAK